MVGYQPFDPNISKGFQDNLASIINKGSFNPQMKLPAPPKPKTADIFGSLPGLGKDPNAVNSSSLNVGGDLGRLMAAIRNQESGGNYGARNSMSGASGAYQIMPFNINGSGGWDMEALGRNVSMQEFMNNKALQDKIASYKLGQYLSKYGAAWYGGPGAVKNMYSKTTQAGGYPSLYAYWTSVLRKMG
jgi:hypothetical protein